MNEERKYGICILEWNTMDYYSIIRKNEVIPSAMTWMFVFDFFSNSVLFASYVFSILCHYQSYFNVYAHQSLN